MYLISRLLYTFAVLFFLLWIALDARQMAKLWLLTLAAGACFHAIDSGRRRASQGDRTSDGKKPSLLQLYAEAKATRVAVEQQARGSGEAKAAQATSGFDALDEEAIARITRAENTVLGVILAGAAAALLLGFYWAGAALIGVMFLLFLQMVKNHKRSILDERSDRPHNNVG